MCADVINWSPISPVHEPSGYAQRDATVTALPDGGYAVVWQTRIGDDVEYWHGRLEIAMRIFNGDGTPRTDETFVSDSPYHADQTASITALADGTLAVVWSNYATNPSSVTIQRMAADGTRLGNVIPLGDVSEDPEITALPGGGFVVVKTHGYFLSDNVTFRSEVLAQRFNAAGQPVGGAVEVTPAGNSSIVYRPHVTALAGGGYLVAWDTTDTVLDNSGSGVFARIVGADGTAQGTPFALASTMASNQWDVRVAALAGGGFVASWSHWSSVENAWTEIRARVFDATGTTMDDDFRVNQSNLLNQNDGAVTALRDGGFAVVWSDEADILIRLFNADGTARGDEVKAFDHTDPTFPGLFGARIAPSVAELADGRLVVTANESETGGANDVWQAILDPRGAQIAGTAAADRVLGNALDNRMTGLAGADDLRGLGGSDLLLGGTGHDSLFGGDGDDILVGGLGNDVLQGDAGRDTARFAGSASVIDLRKSGPQATGEGQDRLIGIENLEGGAARDRFTGTGITNRLDGGGGNDRLFGLGGADVLIGGRGDDSLTGGAGADVLTGGLGADRFLFASAAEIGLKLHDRITDFTRGSDKVNLATLDLVWRDTADFTGTMAEIRLTMRNGDARLMIDSDGDGVADARLDLQGVSVIDAGDLIL